jgi:hypothetical protein
VRRERVSGGISGLIRRLREGERRWKTWQLLAIGLLGLVLGSAVGNASKDQTVRKSQQALVDAQADASRLRAELARQTVATSSPTTVPTTATTRPPSTTTIRSTTTTTTPGPATSFRGEGTYRVGVDIAPGTYRTAGPAAGRGLCYWARLSDLSGSFDAILANDNLEGPGSVTISSSDVGFKTSGCQTWQQV